MLPKHRMETKESNYELQRQTIMISPGGLTSNAQVSFSLLRTRVLYFPEALLPLRWFSR